ncbi:phosphate signaling complex protein PhoU [Mobilicoccus massiliensis]|uniref:phosphate signaling complex protein PhoU n=1 Tax=Mobilicoccus massiliensis TaxID=1522310 RepID=UPI00058FEC93|nr:phosphate signaling complex protein PhoU [Mobilicoccus massiliensis]
MRDAFHEDLDKISDQLVEMTRLAASAMSRATTALLDADLELAESVISADHKIDSIRAELDELAVELLARQQPVATDLRIVVTALHMGTSLERMGDLAEHVAKVARLRFPESAVPVEMRETIVAMGQIADRLVLRAGAIIDSKDVEGARNLSGEDDEMDALHRRVFTILASEEWSHPADVTVDITLLSRYYERFADHAVAVARQVVYLVTGEWRALDNDEIQA